ncbi:hypothetical protein [Tepidibacillus marianensis]|uniref:hypothetical protein n=1 Tax=Tepidibacillus marianensis TaxID=3131995 RepID=UPI0030CA95E6
MKTISKELETYEVMAVLGYSFLLYTVKTDRLEKVQMLWKGVQVYSLKGETKVLLFQLILLIATIFIDVLPLTYDWVYTLLFSFSFLLITLMNSYIFIGEQYIFAGNSMIKLNEIQSVELNHRRGSLLIRDKDKQIRVKNQKKNMKQIEKSLLEKEIQIILHG